MRKSKWMVPLLIVVIGMQSKAYLDQRMEYKALGAYTQELQTREADNKKELANLQSQLKDSKAQVQVLQQTLQTMPKDGSWQMQNGIATAYSPYDNKSGIEADSTSDTTSIGLRPGNGIIAVDPNRIPYGSDMLVIYPDGSTYKGMAGDTGGALRMSRGMHIDIYKDTYAETKQHGVQNVIILWRPKKTTQ